MKMKANMFGFFRKIKATQLLVLSVLFFSCAALLASDATIGSIATKVTGSMAGLAKLITAGAYVGGFGFAVASILKFKAHKDNPTQIPVGTPIALLFVAAALIFLPEVFGSAGKTVFGGSAQKGGISGVSSFS